MVVWLKFALFNAILQKSCIKSLLDSRAMEKENIQSTFNKPFYRKHNIEQTVEIISWIVWIVSVYFHKV